MNGHGSQYLDNFCQENGEHEVALEHFLKHQNRNGKIMEDDLKVAYTLPDGIPVKTNNPELENLYDTDATLTEEDSEELRIRFEDFEVYYDELRRAFNGLEVGEKKYLKLTKQLRKAQSTWNDLRSEIVRRTHFCNRERLDLPEIDYTDEQWTRREELSTNEYIERKKVL